MENHDWTTFKMRISIHSSPEKIFKAFTTQEKLEQWFLRTADFKSENGVSKKRSTEIEKNDTYTWSWHGSADIEEGQVLKNNKKDYLAFTFLGCLVSIEIKEEDGENVVELVQHDIPIDETSMMNYFVGCTRGWTFFLTNLKSILEGGIDLRNKNANLIDVINT